MISAILEQAVRALGGVSVQWNCAPASTTQRIFFANHTSHLDFLAIWLALPAQQRRTVRPVAGRDYWERDALRRYLARDVFNAILVDRRAASSPSQPEAARATTEQIARAMGLTHSLIVFPEGTRSQSCTLSPFKSGLYFLSQLRPDAELIPVYLENLHRILPRGETFPVPMLSRVVLGPPLESQPGEGKPAFLARAQSAVVALGRAS